MSNWRLRVQESETAQYGNAHGHTPAGMEKTKTLRCNVCHLPDFSGQNQVPRLAAQREAYLEAEMRAYRDEGVR